MSLKTISDEKFYLSQTRLATLVKQNNFRCKIYFATILIFLRQNIYVANSPFSRSEPAQYAYLSSRIIYMYLRCFIVRLYSLHVKLFTFPFDLFIFIYFP